MLYAEAGHSCEPEHMLIQHTHGDSLTETELRRIHVFIRLLRKLDWTIAELDRALVALKDADEITPDLMEAMALLERLRLASDADVETFLSLWTEIDTYGNDSLYARLFENRAVVNPPDPDFRLRIHSDDQRLSNAEKLLNEKEPLLLASLRLRADELVAIREDAGLGNDATTSLKNLSTLHRYTALARLMNVRIKELIGLKRLLQSSPFDGPQATLDFIQVVDLITESGFSAAQLEYLFNSEPGERSVISLAQQEVSALAERLRAGLTKIAAEQVLPEEVTSETLENRLSQLLDPDRVKLATALIEARAAGPVASSNELNQNRDRLAAENPGSKVLAQAVANSIFPDPIDLPDEGIAVTPETLRAMLRMVLNDQSAAQAMAFISGADLVGGPFTLEQIAEILKSERSGLIATFSLSASAATTAATSIFPDRKPLNEIDSQERQERMDEAMQAARLLLRQSRTHKAMRGLAPLLRDIQGRTLIKQTLSDTLQLDADVVQRLLEDERILTALNGDPHAITDFIATAGLRAEYFNNKELAGEPVLVRTDSAIKLDWKRERPDQRIGIDVFSVRWSGWVVADRTEEFTFHLRADDGVRLWIDDQLLVDKWQDSDGSAEHNATVQLQSGKFYPIRIDYYENSLDAHISLQWSGKSTPKSDLSSANLVPSLSDAFTRLHRISLLVRTLTLTADELSYFTEHSADFDGFDLSRFGRSPNIEGFRAWKRLAIYASLRARLTSGKTRLVDVFASREPIATLASAAGWDQAMLVDAVAAYGIEDSEIKDERVIERLERLIRLSRRLGVLPKTLKSWVAETPSESQSQAVVGAVKASFDEAAWLETARAINDPLRERQRDALVSYVLTMPQIRHKVRTRNELFEHFLIDVDMSACMLTSRIKQAISSVQLFVQRGLLSLETENGFAADAIDAEQWKWRRNYRVWEANRKIFLYPENWIEPELRDNKSPFFKDLEAELLQADVNDETVERALLTYLEKLDSVARLEICGFHWQRESNPEIDILHVFGRTMTGIPRTYYYRRLVDGVDWTPWEPVSVDIQAVERDDDNATSGVHLLPVVWRGKLYLFWPLFAKKGRESEMVGQTKKMTDDVSFNKTDSDWEIKLAWSRYEQGRWTQKQVSGPIGKWAAEFTEPVKPKPRKPVAVDPSGARLDGVGGIFEGIALDLGETISTSVSGRSQKQPSDLRLRARTAGNGLTINLMEGQGQVAASMSFTDPHSAPEPVSLATAQEVDVLAGKRMYMVQQAWMQFVPGIDSFKLQSTKLLEGSQGVYTIAVPSQDRTGMLATRIPIFYQNAFHSFFVLLSEGSREPIPNGQPSPSGPLFEFYDKDNNLFALPDNMPKKSSSFVEPSPWRDASNRLLPAAIERAAVNLQNVAVAGGPTAMPVMSAPSTGLQVTDNILVDAVDRFHAAPIIEGIFAAGQQTQKTVNAEFSPFFHPHISNFIHELKRKGVPGLLNSSNQNPAIPTTFEMDYRPVKAHVLGTYPSYGVDFSSRGSYSVYNWELFFHVPLLLATRLSLNQRFQEARKWFHYIFDPIDSTPGEGSERFWKVLPLRNLKPESLTEMFMKLKPGDVNSPEEQEVVDQLNAIALHPFQPHRIARLRPAAYKKFTVMKYLENLIAWADQLFRRDTIESINEATLYYVLAAELLGDRPQRIPRAGRIEAKSFAQLRKQFNEAGNGLTVVEHEAPLAGFVAPIEGGSGIEALLSMGTGLYFGIPKNEKLLSYWDLVEDRLFKIRHCMNIEGTVRQLPLFEPPIDPALLVKAAAAGLDIGSVLNDLSAPLPKYRFSTILQKALDICAELKALGASLLSALEKKDAEALQLTRSQHETLVLNSARLVKEWQVSEDRASLNALLASRESAIHVLQHYSRLLGESGVTIPAEPGAPSKPDKDGLVQLVQPQLYVPTGRFELVSGSKITVSGAALGAAAGNMVAGPGGGLVGGAIGAAAGDLEVAALDTGTKLLKYEEQDIFQSFLAAAFSMGSAVVGGLESMLALIPQAEISLKPLGIGGSINFGGKQLSAATKAVAGVLQAFSTWHGFKGSLAGKQATYVWREQEHTLQRNKAALEIGQIDKQIIAAKIRLKIAEVELDNHDQQVQQAAEITKFLEQKYTREELYVWMQRELSDLYFQSYQLAYDLAKKAERCFRFELGLTDSNFIRFGYWDSLRKGLMSGERLHLSLKQLERAYLDQNRRELEITKHISLLQLDPLAIIKLRRTGQCEFELPEALFDIDFPGHYFRRIKSVSLSVPCVVGPYTGVSGTLTLLNNRIRVKTAASPSYAENPDEDDSRFIRDFVPSQSIATSTAVNDSGMFELNFRDERYLPFEGGGAVSRWRFELPDQFRQFDYETISDLIVHLRYTARDAGAQLRQRASSELLGAVNELTQGNGQPGMARVFSLKHEFPTEWHRLVNIAADNGNHQQSFELAKERFPFLFQGNKLKLTQVELFAVPKSEKKLDAADFELALAVPGQPEPVNLAKSGEIRGILRMKAQLDGLEVQPKSREPKWIFTVKPARIASTLEPLADLLVLCSYRAEKMRN